jgi:hypothetical protein
VVAASGILKIIIEDPGLTVAEGDFHVGRTPLDGGISLLDDQSRSPLGISVMNNPISDLQIQIPCFFHNLLISNSFPKGKPKRFQFLSPGNRSVVLTSAFLPFEGFS